MKRTPVWVVGILLLVLAGTRLFAQQPSGSGSLRGTVTDPSGAVVTNATVAVVTPDGKTVSAVTGKTGVYEIKGLVPGKYTVTANAQGFSIFVQDDVSVEADKINQFNISLEISVQEQKIDVQEQTTQVDVNPASNAGAIVLSGKDLEALSDDPDELQSDLEALAGPSAGPNGGQLYIDGFTAGQLPPKASIREIRVNQNPFSSEYDKLGYGRIEVFTKPGTDKFHGQISVLGNSSAFNSQNPFLTDEPPYHSTQYMGNIGGPINKKASFFFDFQRRNINEVSVINATILNPACVPNVPASCDVNNPGLAYTAAVSNPFTRTNIGPRVDYQLSKNNTLTMRYQFWRETEENNGIGQFALQSQGYRVWTVGDDIAWMHVASDGMLHAINPEAGFFGVAPGTNGKTNPNVMAAIHHDTIFTNVALTESREPWWEGMDSTPPPGLTDWHGHKWSSGKSSAAHPNSRYTVPAPQSPSISPHWEDPQGLPISALIFGGRRTRLAPLVYESRSWQHGVFVGATMASETTAAATGAVGVTRRDPMAMLPFCGYNMGDYFGHWLTMGSKLKNPPKIFHVNWFRRDADGKFLWPGYGENVRVLKWILERIEGRAGASETPIGCVPTPSSLTLDGLSVSRDTLNELLAVDSNAWANEEQAVDRFFAKFGSNLPGALRQEQNALATRLQASASAVSTKSNKEIDGGSRFPLKTRLP